MHGLGTTVRALLNSSFSTDPFQGLFKPFKAGAGIDPVSFNTSLLFNETVGLSDKVDVHFVSSRPPWETIKSWNIWKRFLRIIESNSLLP